MIKKQYFGVTSDTVKDMLVGWDIVCKSEAKTQKRKISYLLAAVVIEFYGGLQGGEVFLTSMKGILNF